MINKLHLTQPLNLILKPTPTFHSTPNVLSLQGGHYEPIEFLSEAGWKSVTSPQGLPKGIKVHG